MSKILPSTGKPGSVETLNNTDGTPKQKRWYGPDGNPVRDREYKFSLKPVLGTVIVAANIIGIAVVAADDATGVGVVNDVLFISLGAGVSQGLIMIFGR